MVHRYYHRYCIINKRYNKSTRSMTRIEVIKHIYSPGTFFCFISGNGSVVLLKVIKIQDH